MRVMLLLCRIQELVYSVLLMGKFRFQSLFNIMSMVLVLRSLRKCCRLFVLFFIQQVASILFMFVVIVGKVFSRFFGFQVLDWFQRCLVFSSVWLSQVFRLVFGFRLGVMLFGIGMRAMMFQQFSSNVMVMFNCFFQEVLRKSRV